MYTWTVRGRWPSNLSFKISYDGISTNSWSSPLQCWTTLTIWKFLLKRSWNCLYCNWNPLLQFLPTRPKEYKLFYSSTWPPFKYLRKAISLSLASSLFRAKYTQLLLYQFLKILLKSGVQNWILCFKWGLTTREQSGTVTSLHLDMIPLLLRSSTALGLAYFVSVTASHCWLMFSLQFTKTIRSFPFCCQWAVLGQQAKVTLCYRYDSCLRPVRKGGGYT